MRRILLVCMAWWCGLAFGAEQSESAQGANTAVLVQQLDSEDFDTREAASKKLLQAGKTVLPALKSGLASGKHGPEFERRVQRLLALLDDLGVEVNGLRIGLAGDKQVLALGESITLTITVSNTSDKEQTLFLGMNYNPFEKGTHLRLSSGDLSGGVDPRSCREPECIAEILWKPTRVAMNATIPSKTSVKFTSSMTLEKLSDALCLKIGKSGHLAFTRMEAGRYALGVCYTHAGEPAAEPRFWTGSAVSNLVSLEIKADAKTP